MTKPKRLREPKQREPYARPTHIRNERKVEKKKRPQDAERAEIEEGIQEFEEESV